MAQNEFFGTTYAVTHGAYTLEGILDVQVDQKGGPEPEQVDITRSGHTKYTYIPHPLGSAGQAVVTLTVICQASTASYADSKAAAIPGNTAAATKVEWKPATANANEFNHTTLELIQRTTKIKYAGKELATVTFVFEGNGAGAWTSPA